MYFVVCHLSYSISYLSCKISTQTPQKTKKNRKESQNRKVFSFIITWNMRTFSLFFCSCFEVGSKNNNKYYFTSSTSLITHEKCGKSICHNSFLVLFDTMKYFKQQSVNRLNLLPLCLTFLLLLFT